MAIGTELAVLASAAAGRFIETLTTDGWETVKAAVASLWRHARPQQINASLADDTGDPPTDSGTTDDQALHGLSQAEWPASLIKLLAEQPDVIDQVRKLIHEERAGAAPPGQHEAVSMTLQAHVSGGVDAHRAGRDMMITEDRSA